ncbi:MAG: PIN domain-containing protein [Chloroherpetonaceae bacterium]|nr:PIN domain-containing protein [Chloroherpetonaceae bacterium]MDW8464806.1 PIN domain-containing protein [Chloroherpetonaceae bacterium]
MLVDTNVFLEVLLAQKKEQAARNFLQAQPKGSLYISEFSLNSIGLKLFAVKRKALWQSFCEDLRRNRVTRLYLQDADIAAFIAYSDQWNLDFDDAYQYTLAKKHGLELVSFDADFDRTDLKRIEPQ